MAGGGQDFGCSSLGSRTLHPFSPRQRTYHFRHGAHPWLGRNLQKDTTSCMDRRTFLRKLMMRPADVKLAWVLCGCVPLTEQGTKNSTHATGSFLARLLMVLRLFLNHLVYRPLLNFISSPNSLFYCSFFPQMRDLAQHLAASSGCFILEKFFTPSWSFIRLCFG